MTDKTQVTSAACFLWVKVVVEKYHFADTRKSRRNLWFSTREIIKLAA